MLNREIEARKYLVDQTVAELRETAIAWNEYYGKPNAPADQADRMCKVVEQLWDQQDRLWKLLSASVPALTATELEFLGVK